MSINHRAETFTDAYICSEVGKCMKGGAGAGRACRVWNLEPGAWTADMIDGYYFYLLSLEFRVFSDTHIHVDASNLRTGA
jgi:hypothetical protein